jgi:hypothetical protein
VGAWILTLLDIRRKRPNDVPTEEEIEREFSRLVHRR